MIIIKAGGHLIGHRSCMRSNCSGISGLLPDPEPITQVFRHLRTHPWGFLKLRLSEETHPPELSFEGTDPVVSEEVLHGGWPQPLSQESTVTSPLPLPTPRSSQSRRIQQAFSHEPIVSKNCPATPDRRLGLVFGFHFQKSFSESWTVGCLIPFISLLKPPYHVIDSACSVG